MRRCILWYWYLPPQESITVVIGLCARTDSERGVYMYLFLDFRNNIPTYITMDYVDSVNT